MEYPGQEKRRDTRVKHPFTARIRVHQEGGESEESLKWDVVTMRDLSASGVSFNYTKKIESGTVIEFNIAVPFTEEPFQCLGEVCRVDEQPTDRIRTRKIPVYGIAVRFKEIESDVKKTIKKFAEESYAKK